jgi:hypothetical protein
MLLRLLILVIGFSCYSFQTLAQAYEPGLLVRSNGDTLRGEIENRFWVEPPTFIRFRAAAAGPVQEFQPRQLRAVNFTGGRHFSYQVLPIDHAAKTELASLPHGNFVDTQIDSLLAEVLLEGPVPLWRVVSNGVPHYLLRRANQPVLDLNPRKYLSETRTGAWVITDGNNYHNQLMVLFGDCPEAAAAALTAPFTPEGIIGVVQAFNTACGPTQEPARSWLAQSAVRRRVSFQGGLLAGARYNRIESSSYALAGTCSDCRPHPFAGLYAELLQPSRLSAIYGELSLSSFHSQGSAHTDYDPITRQDIYTTYDYHASLATARLGIRYFSLLPKEQQLILGLSFELNKVLNPTISSTGGPAVTPYREELGYATTTLLPGLGLGWRTGRFTLSLDGQLYISSDSDGLGGAFFGSNYAVRSGLAYRLGRNPDDTKPRTAATR